MQAQQVTTKGPQQVAQITKEPQRVTTKNPKIVGKRLAMHNRGRREEQRKEPAQLEKSGENQYYGIGAVLALGVIGGLGYYIYQSRKGPAPREVTMPASQQPSHPQAQQQANKFEMD